MCGLFVKIDVFSTTQRGLGAELHCLSMKVGKKDQESWFWPVRGIC